MHYAPTDEINASISIRIRWILKVFQNSHLTNANFDQFRHITTTTTMCTTTASVTTTTSSTAVSTMTTTTNTTQLLLQLLLIIIINMLHRSN